MFRAADQLQDLSVTKSYILSVLFTFRVLYRKRLKTIKCKICGIAEALLCTLWMQLFGNKWNKIL